MADLLLGTASRPSTDLLSGLHPRSTADLLSGDLATARLADLLSISSPSSLGDLLSPAATVGPSSLTGLTTLGLPALTLTTLTQAGQTPSILDTNLLTSYGGYTDELVTLRKQLAEQTRALNEKETSAKEHDRKISAFLETLRTLDAKERLGFVLSRVGKAAQQRLLESPKFCDEFLGKRECSAFVLAVDIRRSTELMLKGQVT